MQPYEVSAGPTQTIVVYMSDDTGNEVDPYTLYQEVAADAAARAVHGQRIVSLASVPLRHSAAYLGREGSGYETKVAVAVVYTTG